MDSPIYQALIFIGSSVILVPLCQSLGFGSVLGYLIAGILVGPHGLQLVHDAESAMRLAELGVTFLLFVIGLEIQPRKLWSMRRHLFGLGGLQVLTTTLAFWVLGRWFGLSATTAAVIGFGLSLSSTAFAVQTLTEKNQFNTIFGRSSFAVLLMQDLVAIPALALIPALGVSIEGQRMTWQSLFAALAVILFLVLASRYLIRPAFRAILSTRSREVFTAAVLFITLGVAVLMQQVGLSAALGTFIAGVLLSDSEYRHELEVNIDPFKSLFMGLFFIAVGMGVNLELIVREPLRIFALALAYLAVKGLVIYSLGRSFKLNHDNSKRMALSIAEGGEFAFVIFGLVLHAELVQSGFVDFLVAIVTLSMALSPLINFADEYLTRLKLDGTEPDYDKIPDESPEVIIAGFGRFGQIFGRLLRAQNIPFVAIDRDAQQIELLRRFGSKVYYGDASRIDLLEAAGAARAKYFILAIDNIGSSLQTAAIIKKRFPNLKLFARARNRGHVYSLMDMGVEHIKREVLDSSISFARDLLIEMGHEPAKAKVIVERFQRHDELMLNEQFKVRADDKALINVSNQGFAQLAQVLSEDSMQTYIDRQTAASYPGEPNIETP